MKKSLKISLITAGVLVFLGIALIIVAAVLTGGDLSKLGAAKYVTSVFDIDGEFDNISVNTGTANIKFVLSYENKCVVECFEEETRPHSVFVQDGTLKIKMEDNRKWYQIFVLDFQKPTLTISLPDDEYSALTINEDTGDIEIPRSFIFESIDIKSSTGNVKCDAYSRSSMSIVTSTGDISVDGLVARNINLTVSTGNIKVFQTTVCEDISINVSTGKTVIESVDCRNLITGGSTGNIDVINVHADIFDIERSTGDVTFKGSDAKQLKVKTSTGDVTFSNSDAGQLNIETTTGDVTGSLKTEKIFYTETSTGRVEHPKTTSGGICEIKTTSGDIIIEVIS